jgi:uncharacterized protein YfdQ (DUF2303 family)
MSAEQIEALVALGKAACQPFDAPEGGKIVVLPDGYRLQHIPPLDEPLTHIKESPHFSEHASFVEYLKKYSRDDTCIFANQSLNNLTAVIDYHGKNLPAHCDHVAHCNLSYADQWVELNKISELYVKHVDFAEFIEENAQYIYAPSSAEVLEMARSLQIKQTVEFASAVNLENGAVQIKYMEEQDGKGRGDIEVPRILTFGLPVFTGSDAVKVTAFLRTRIANRTLNVTLKVNNKNDIIRHEFQRIAAEIKNETGVPVYFGLRY